MSIGPRQVWPLTYTAILEFEYHDRCDHLLFPDLILVPEIRGRSARGTHIWAQPE